MQSGRMQAEPQSAVPDKYIHTQLPAHLASDGEVALIYDTPVWRPLLQLDYPALCVHAWSNDNAHVRRTLRCTPLR
jgi:hypothetical protein